MDPSEPAAPALAASEPAGAEALLRRCFGARNVLRLPVALQMVRGYGGHVVVDPSTSFNGLEPGAEASEGDVRAWSETLVCLRDRGHLRVPPEDLDVSGAVREGAFDPRSALGVVEMAGRVLAFADVLHCCLKLLLLFWTDVRVRPHVELIISRAAWLIADRDRGALP